MVMGASPNEWRYSYIATRMLKDYGHKVTCFGRRNGTCAGEPILTEFPQMDDLDTLTLYLSPEHQKEYYERILALKPKRVIFNPGTENEDLENLLEANGIQSEEACTLVLLRTGQY